MRMPHTVARPILSVLLIGLLCACGGSANKDFDLNTASPDRSEDATDAAAVFDDPWLTGSDEDWIYTINEGDRLEVALFTHPEQTRFVRVRPDGRISLPYLGDLKAVGQTPSELASEIQERYSEVLVSPRVDVLVQEMGGQYYVLGEVVSGGEFEYERPVTLMQAVARAGGYNENARLTNLVLLRRSDRGQGFAAVLNFRDLMGSNSKMGDIRLRPFDIVWVPKDRISRWDNATSKVFTGVLQGQDAVINGWSLIKFEEVFSRTNIR